MITKFEYLIAKLIKKLHLRAVIKSEIHRSSKICAGSHIVNTKLDKHSDIGYDCTIINTKIGAFCSLGANVRIGGSPHSIYWVSTSPVFNENSDHLKTKFSKHKFDLDLGTEVGNDVWIGDNVLVKAGVIVGDGAVIGMGSVVTKNIPAYEIWGGNPARFIKKRFDEDVIEKLLSIKWWNWNDIEIRKHAKNFNDIYAFIHEYEVNKNNEK